MNTHPFDKITIKTGASFIFTPCPGTKEATIEESVQALKSADSQAIITLMYDKEIATNNAENLSKICEQQGVKWFQLPISDDAAPNDDFMQSWNNNLTAIKDILQNNGTVAVHCKGGSGRTGLVIGLLMTELGIEKEVAKSLVQSVRPKALTHPVQLEYFESF